MSFVCKPLELFFEEKVVLMDHLLNINKLPMLAKTFAMRIELGGQKTSELFGELFRCIAKKSSYEEGKSPLIMLGHPDLHRVLKDLVKLEVDTGKVLDYTKKLVGLIKENLE